MKSTEISHLNELEDYKLIETILFNFHEKHRKDLDTLIPLAHKVESVHTDDRLCPKGLAEFLGKLSFELESHMMKEEQVLFPMLKSGNHMMATMPVKAMMHEHVDHIENLKELRDITKNYELPIDACGSWQSLYVGVERLEREILEHISVENDVLFPRVLQLCHD